MLENLLYKIEQFNPEANLDIVIKAYNYAKEKHEGQYRRSGEKYIMHPVEVAKILAELELDVATIAAALMHDVLEDTPTSFEQMKEIFGEEITQLVDGVTKLGKLEYKTKEENQTENLRKMFMAMGKDVRVVLIKLADRLHNMRTLKFMPPRKAKEKSKETLEIFAPIAGRLGISKIKWEMEDIAIRYLEPDAYYDLVERISRRINERDKYINDIINTLKEKIDEAGIECEIHGRSKHIYSIYKKMKYKHRAFEEIYDLMAVRVIVDTVKDCYGAIGIAHTIWKPIPKRFKDYIAMPKANMYQSIHTTILGPDGEPVEIQIRTKEMHRTAEFGIAAHWKYKEGRIDPNESDMDKKLAWLRQIMDWQKDVSDPTEFMESLKIDLFANQVFVFTPKGDVIELPAGSCPLDLAYKIHSNVGNKCVGAKVLGKIVPLDYELKNGDVVEIITSASSRGPSRDWLNLVKSSHSKNKIRQWFKKEKKEENIEKGKELLDKEVKKLNLPVGEYLKSKTITTVAKQLNQNTEEDLYAALGYGGLTINQVMNRLREQVQKNKPAKTLEDIQKANENQEVANEQKPERVYKKKFDPQRVNVTGVDNILTRLAKCCNPIPGDKIVGYITKGRGVSVHRADCVNIINAKKDGVKLIEVEWNNNFKNTHFDAELQIRAYDRNSLFADVSKLFSDEKANLITINARKTKDNLAIMDVVFEISSKEKLKSIIQKLKSIPDVQDVFRISK